MRATTISTAALCSLSALIAYGVSNRVNSTPELGSEKEKPTVNPAAPALAATLPIARSIAPPESLAPQPITTKQNLLKERQQREARLTQDLAKVAVPALPPVTTPPPPPSANIPNIKTLPLDQLVAQATQFDVSANSNMVARSRPATAQPAVSAKIAQPSSSSPSNSVAAAQSSVSPQPALAAVAVPSPQPATPPAPTTPIASIAPPASITSPAPATSTAPIARTQVNSASNPVALPPAATTPPASIASPPPATPTAPIARTQVNSAIPNPVAPTPAATTPPASVTSPAPATPTAPIARTQVNSANSHSVAPNPETANPANSVRSQAAPSNRTNPNTTAGTPSIAPSSPTTSDRSNGTLISLQSARPTPPSIVSVATRPTVTNPPASTAARIPSPNPPSSSSPVAITASPVTADTSPASQSVKTHRQSTSAATPTAVAPIVRSVTTQSASAVRTLAQSVVQTTTPAPTNTSAAASTHPSTANVPVASYPTAQPASTHAVISAPAVNQAYTLGPGDRISLRFFNAPEYDGEVQVLSDGTLNLPVVGNFSVAGMTLQQAEAEIAARYQRELRYSVVTVSLQQSRPLQVAIVGEVQQPGSYTLSPEGAQFPGIVRALQLAGGTTQSADLRNIQVRRSDRSNPNQVIAVNLVDFLQSGNLGQDLKLRDGDQIVIPTAAVVDFAEAPQIAAANFAASASQPIDVAIVGEVFRPGTYKTGGNGRPNITEVIQLAGGVKPSANVRAIQVRRSTRSGTEQIIDIDFGQLIQSGNISQDLTLQQGDRITIPVANSLSPADTTLLAAANISPETMSVNVVGEVKAPGRVQVSPGSSLNQVILAAGGLNNRATRELEIIRLEPNGTLTRRTIEMDIKQGFDTATNPMLLNNDIVVVGRSGMAQFADQLGQINSVVGPLLQLIPFRLPSF